MKNTNNIRTSNIATGLKVEKRKHYSQMNTSEIKSLYAKLLSVTTKNWRMSYHAEERLVQKRIDASRSRIVDVINHCEIIEYKTVDNGRYTCERVYPHNDSYHLILDFFTSDLKGCETTSQLSGILMCHFGAKAFLGRFLRSRRTTTHNLFPRLSVFKGAIYDSIPSFS